MHIDKIQELVSADTPGEAVEQVRLLMRASRLASQLLDALRVDNGVGQILTPGERESFRFADEMLKDVLGVER